MVHPQAWRGVVLWHGLFTASTCLFEQSKGAGLVLGLTARFLIVLRTERQPSGWNQQRLAGLLAGLLGPFLVTLAYFGMEHSLLQMLADWFWPLHHYSAVNKTFFGFLPIDPAKGDIYAGDGLSRFLITLVTGPWYIIPILSFSAACILVRWTARAWQGRLSPNRCSHEIVLYVRYAGRPAGSRQ